MPVALQILIPVILLTGLAVVFAVLIAVCSKKFAVVTDERVDKVASLLSGANCGGCGYAGCDAFAAALVKGEAQLGMCNATSKANKVLIAEVLGGADAGEETIVVCACSGGELCSDKYDYQGYGDCASVELLAGGRKSCPVGCIGMSKCVSECPAHAIDIVGGVAVVNQEKCVSCGRCIMYCPKKLLKRVPASAKYYIACSNCDKGKEVRVNCAHGCIGCGLCARNCPEGAITLKDNLPVIDYAKCVSCGVCAEKCPSKCILAVRTK